ncbi:MAG: ATP-binding cassette domain-containing protein [Anaerolineae bacterium]|nr:ATP-binding cassette domain-containing protein [Anaerolineae bacterium]
MSRRVDTPTLLQTDTAESGAVSLGIVLRYYGNFTPLEELRYACAVTHDGSSLGNLIKAAQFYGLEAEWLQCGIADMRDLPMPQIVPWYGDQFVVLEGFGRRVVYLNDPAYGRRTVTLGEFEDGFGSVTVVLRPTGAFQRAGQPFEVRRALDDHLRGTRTALLYLAIISLFLLVPGILLPSFLRVFVDDILSAGQNWISALLFGMSITGVFAALLTWLQRLSLLRLESRIGTRASLDLLWHVLHLPVAISSQRSGGDFAAHIASGERATRLIFGAPAVVTINVLLSIFFALVMLQYSVILTVICILFSVFSLLIFGIILRRQRDTARIMLHERGRLAASLMDGLRVLESFKASATEKLLLARWTDAHARAVSAEQELGSSTNLLSAVSIFLIGMNVAILLIGGGALVMQGALTVGMLVAYQSLLISFSLPVGQLLNLSGRLQEGESELRRVEDVFANNSADPHAEPAEAFALTGQLELRGVSFGYHPLQQPFIDDFSLTIRPGQRVALVGAPGSGKSTIARLITGLYPAWEGQILFDGLERTAIPPAALSSAVALVDQQVTLFTATVQENLTLWNEYSALTDLWRAAKDACIHETILRRPDGYNHLVEEDGRNFSASERQCLEIARALVDNPTLLILDEDTSALDPVTEAKVLENLGWRGCACLVIAQRLTPVVGFDEIIVMEAGTVAERGTHAELIERGGLYARLFAAETRATEPARAPYSRLQPAWLRQPARSLAVRSGSAETPGTEPRDPPRDLRGLLRVALEAAGGASLLVIAAGLIVGLLGLALPLATTVVIDTATTTGDRRLLQSIGLVLALAALGLATFQWIRGAAVLRVQAALDQRLQPALWDRLLRLPASYLRPFTSGDLADRALSFDAIKSTLGDLAALSPVAAVFAVVNFGLLLYFDVPLALFAVALIAGSLALAYGIGGIGLHFERLRAELKGESSGLMLQMLNGLIRLRAAGAEDRALGMWAQLFIWQQRLRFKTQRAQSLAAMFAAAFPLLGAMVIFALVYARGSLTLSQFVGFNVAFFQLSLATASLCRTLAALRQAAPALARLQPLVQTIREDSPGKHVPELLAGAITVRNVSFRYADGLPLVVSNLSFHIEPGEFIAIVGASGAGKSTLARLLLGFEKPTVGEIFYDDQPLSTLNTAALRRQVSAVLQESRVFNSNVWSNISGVYELDEDEIWRAARAAGIADDIRRMPTGLKTHVEHSGGAFTTAQRQRLLFARALAAQPRILLLDDATNALDDHAQTQLMRALRYVAATRIVITSRLTAAAAADRILVVEAGQIVESGTYASLVRAGGHFTALAQTQQR